MKTRTKIYHSGKTQLINAGVIDNSFKEINLSDFLKAKPDLIKNLKAKYNL